MAFEVQGFQQPNYQVNPVAGNKYAPQDGMTQLSNLLDYQGKNLALQKQQALQQAQIEQGLAESQSAQSQAKTAATQAQASEFKLKGDKFASALDVIGARATDPRVRELSVLATKGGPEGLKAQDELHKLNGQDFKALKQKGLTDEEALYQLGHISSLIHERPNELPNIYENIVRQSASAASKLALQTPGTTTNALGQIVRVNPNTNQIEVLGQANTANPTAAQAGMTNAAATTMSGDYALTQKDANDAQPRIATFQNIKKLVPEAYTGVGGERKKFLTGLANAVGIDVNTLENSTTDELAKNSAILQLAGGNTDAARAIASIATPSGKMTKDAIINVSNQMIGMEKLKQAKAEFLAPAANDPVAYQQRLQQFNKINDYRIFQEATPAEIAKLKKSMTAEEQAQISDKIRLARQMGLIK